MTEQMNKTKEELRLEILSEIFYRIQIREKDRVESLYKLLEQLDKTNE